MLEKLLTPGSTFTLPKKMDDQKSDYSGSRIYYEGGSFETMAVRKKVDATMLAHGKAKNDVFTETKVKYQWLPYAPGHSSEMLLSSFDILTGYMSGCPLYTRVEGAKRYAGHMGTVDSVAGLTGKLASQLSSVIDDNTDMAFNPRYEWTFKQFQDAQAAHSGVIRMLGLWTPERAVFRVVFAQAGKTNTIVAVEPADEVRGHVFKQWMAGTQTSLWIDR